MKQVLTFATLFLYSLSNAQEHKTYSGIFESGKATYQYFENPKSDRIYEGNFSYTGNPYSVVGKFANNIRIGKWKISALNKMYKNDKSRIQVTTSIFGAYKDGALDSTWNYSNSIKTFNQKTKKFNPKPLKIVSKATFKNNHFVGNLSYQIGQGSTTSFTGQFTENGFPDGLWVKKSALETEEWRFLNGVLVAHLQKNNATGDKTVDENNASMYARIWENYDPSKNLATVGDKMYFLDTIEFQHEALKIWQADVLQVEGFGSYINPFHFYERSMQSPSSMMLIFIECTGETNCYLNYIQQKNAELEAQKRKEFEEAEKLRLEALAKEEQIRLERERELERQRQEQLLLLEQKADALLEEKKYKAAYASFIELNTQQFTDKTLLKIRLCETEINRIDSLHIDLTNKFNLLKSQVEPTFTKAYEYEALVKTKKKVYASNYVMCIDYLKTEFNRNYRNLSIEQTPEETEKWNATDQARLSEIELMLKQLEEVTQFSKLVQEAVAGNQKARLRILNSSLNPKVIIQDFVAYKPASNFK